MNWIEREDLRSWRTSSTIVVALYVLQLKGSARAGVNTGDVYVPGYTLARQLPYWLHGACVHEQISCNVINLPRGIQKLGRTYVGRQLLRCTHLAF